MKKRNLLLQDRRQQDQDKPVKQGSSGSRHKQPRSGLLCGQQGGDTLSALACGATARGHRLHRQALCGRRTPAGGPIEKTSIIPR